VGDLPDKFWSVPQTASTTMTRKQLQDVLLRHDGAILACGYMWDIKSKSIGPGVYKVTLQRQA